MPGFGHEITKVYPKKKKVSSLYMEHLQQAWYISEKKTTVSLWNMFKKTWNHHGKCPNNGNIIVHV